MVFLTGQVLPVREVVAPRARRGASRSIVDGAHSFAHLAFTLADLDCDYFGTSLHKWLFAPHGTGMLFVRRDRIAGALAADGRAARSWTHDIRKFEEIGTHPAAPLPRDRRGARLPPGDRPERKVARLRYLRDRWAQRLLPHPTGAPAHQPRARAVVRHRARSQVDGRRPRRARRAPLGARTASSSSPIKHDEFEGVRVTPSVYTTLEEIDRFCDAVEAVPRSWAGRHEAPAGCSPPRRCAWRWPRAPGPTAR